MKNIFLSASIPLENRHPKYFDTADVIAIRDSVIALTSILLPKHRIIWGGHPSITPLVNYVVEKTIENRVIIENERINFTNEEKENLGVLLKKEIQTHIRLYQSLYFKKKFPPDNEKFENILFTEDLGDPHASINLMRSKMLGENEFSAAVFIGGMEGVEDEYNMFKEAHPQAILLPIASTGGATKIIYENIFPEDLKNVRFEKDYGYMSLFQKYLIEKI